MSSNPIIPDAKNIAQNEYANNKLPEVLPDNFTRTLTAGNRQHKNLIHGIYHVKCNEHTINEKKVNYPSVVPNIILVQEIIGVINGIEYFTETTKKELHFIITEWNNGNRNYPDFFIPIEKYQRTFNIPSIEQARERIKTTVKVLISCSIIILNNSKSNYSATNFPMFKHLNYKKNIISVIFFEDFFQSLKGTNSFVFIDSNIYQLPPIPFLLYWRLVNHRKMKVGQYNENIISVSSLLESCTSLPPEEIVEKDFTNRIKKPFEKGMNCLCEEKILKEWFYCRSNGTPLSDKELYEDRFFYKKFKTYYVRYTMNDHDEIRKVYFKSQKNKINHQNRVKKGQKS
jgi:hypothetical protein